MSVLTEILYPRRCLLCEQLLRPQEPGPLCAECHPEAFRITGPRCRICSRPVLEDGTVCRSCLVHDSTVPGISFLDYRGPVREAIHRFKYDGRKAYGEDFARLIAAWWERPEEPMAFVPVPIHKSRYAQRGFNQSLELAKALTVHTGIPTAELLRRSRKTSMQNRLTAKARRENLQGAFTYTGTPVPPGTLIVVDDIYTSGSTVEAMADALQTICPGRPVRFLTIAMRLYEQDRTDDDE